jgi:hypothetical protein
MMRAKRDAIHTLVDGFTEGEITHSRAVHILHQWRRRNEGADNSLEQVQISRRQMTVAILCRGL